MQGLSRESLQRQIAESHIRNQNEKQSDDRRRSALVLVIHFLTEQGLLDSAQRLQLESGISLTKYDVADNIDLLSIIHQYSDFYEFKYGKRPKLYKRSAGSGEGGISNRSAPGLAGLQGKSHQKNTGKTVRNNKDRASVPKAKIEEDEGCSSVFDGLVGTTMCAGVGGRTSTEQVVAPDCKLLKPMPYLDEEQRALASIISRDIYLENAGVSWNDIAELTAAKTLLKEAIVLPIIFPSLFTGILTPWKGILLHGPPGVGKTLLAKAVATECNSTFFNVKTSSIISKWRGDSEKLIRILFELARHHAPSTIFIDEIDSIMSSRSGQSEHEASRRMKTELLIQMDGLATSNALVFVLAASNVPWDLDVAVLRRLEKRILVPLPNAVARGDIIRKCLDEDRAPSINIEKWASLTDGYSGADIKAVCKEAAMRPIRRLFAECSTNKICLREGDAVPAVSDCDFESALNSIRPSTSGDVIDKYQQWQCAHGSDMSSAQ